MLKTALFAVLMSFGVVTHTSEGADVWQVRGASWCETYQPEWEKCLIGQRLDYPEHQLTVVILENDLMEQHLLLLRGGHVVFDRYGHSMFWGTQVDPKLRVGVDLSGEGTPYLVISNHQQGSGGYVDYSLVRIDDRVEEVTAFETTEGAVFSPLDRGWSMTYQDDHWRFELGLYSYRSGWPSLVRVFDGEGFAVSSEHLRQPVPSLDELVWRGFESIEFKQLMVNMMVTGHADLARRLFFWHVEEDASQKWASLVDVAMSHPHLDEIDGAQGVDTRLLWMPCLANQTFGEALKMDRLGQWSNALRQYELFEQLLKAGRWCSRSGAVFYGEHFDRLGAVTFEFVQVRRLLIRMRLGQVGFKEMADSVHISKMPEVWPVGFGGRPVIRYLAGAMTKVQFVERCRQIWNDSKKWNDINQLVPQYVAGSDVQPTMKDVCSTELW